MLKMSDYELGQLRATQESVMPELVTIERKSIVSDGFGGATTQANTTVATNVPARITQAQVIPMAGQAARTLELEQWTIRVPHGTDLQDEDYVIWGSFTLIVEDVKDRFWNTCVTASAEIVK